jgi:hypothetical protein
MQRHAHPLACMRVYTCVFLYIYMYLRMERGGRSCRYDSHTVWSDIYIYYNKHRHITNIDMLFGRSTSRAALAASVIYYVCVSLTLGICVQCCRPQSLGTAPPTLGTTVPGYNNEYGMYGTVVHEHSNTPSRPCKSKCYSQNCR